VDRLAELTGQQAAQVALLRETRSRDFDGDAQFDVTMRIADLRDTASVTGRSPRRSYARALELRADDPRALVALEALYEERRGKRGAARRVERRVEIAERDEERKELLYRRARLLAETMQDRRVRSWSTNRSSIIALEPTAVRALGSSTWTSAAGPISSPSTSGRSRQGTRPRRTSG
jgi:hypothetical protein